jgi:hypothetical protein
VGVRIHEAGHHHGASAIDGLGLQPPRLCFEIAGSANPQDAGPLGQYPALGDNPELQKGFSTPGSGRAREGEQLFSVAEEQ